MIDANIFLEVILKQEKKEECKNFLKLIRDKGIKALMSDFTLSAMIVVLLRKKKTSKEIRIFLYTITSNPNLFVYPDLLPDKIFATKLMEKYNLDIEDSLALHCAIANGCKEIVSLDKDFDKVKEIKRITPLEAIKKYGKGN